MPAGAGGSSAGAIFACAAPTLARSASVELGNGSLLAATSSLETDALVVGMCTAFDTTRATAAATTTAAAVPITMPMPTKRMSSGGGAGISSGLSADQILRVVSSASDVSSRER